MKTLGIIILALLLISCAGKNKSSCNDHFDAQQYDESSKIDLRGKWQFVAPEDQKDIIKYISGDLPFKDSIILPGSIADNKKETTPKARGKIPWEDKTEWALSQDYSFEGIALYKREIEIPENWQGKRIELFLERTRQTRVWIDGKYVGYNDMLSTPHQYELGKLSPGKHELLIAVDNQYDINVLSWSHAIVFSTQTNWNGIIGGMYLEATPLVWIKKTCITTDIHEKKTVLNITLGNISDNVQDISINASAKSFNTQKQHEPDPVQKIITCGRGGSEISLILDMGEKQLLWDEFDPALYRLNLELDFQGSKHLVNETFGMVDFRSNGKQFTVNGKVIFLRGKHDGCVFPLTGYTSMDKDEWVRLMKIAKKYGINHYRFHSWCPPGAAFEAADLVGIYMQPELSSWNGLSKSEDISKTATVKEVLYGLVEEAKPVYNPENITHGEQYFTKEGNGILDVYGNHASFRLFALGNEMHGNRTVMQRMVDHFRNYDHARRLYAQGSNNFITDPSPGKTDDYWTTMRTSTKMYHNNKANVVRASFASVSQQQEGPINALSPSTTFDFYNAIDSLTIPVISHENGQYLFFPDFHEMDRYTGVLKPYNFEIFKKRFIENGMGERTDKFFQAAGKLSTILYLEDMESLIRTTEMAGFQLLDLQDYPGQCTALVGILNVFMESKGLITPEKWREFCNDVVILGRFEKYVYRSGEPLNIKIEVANYRKNEIENATIKWSVVGVDQGIIRGIDIEQGKITPVGEVTVTLPELEKARKVSINLDMKGMEYEKSYPIWIFPSEKSGVDDKNVMVVRELNDSVEERLKKGGRVLFIPDHDKYKDISLGGTFITTFWAFPKFHAAAIARGYEPSPGTMGLLIDNKHPALKEFPTESHSNWQWWAPTKNSRTLILDDAPVNLKPIVETIDNVWRGHRLGTLFEAKVDEGKLFVSAIDLLKIKNTPEGEALYNGIIEYMAGDKFNPKTEIKTESKFWNQLILKE